MISYNQLVSWAPECFERFGSIDQLPIVRSSYAQCRRLFSGGRILDIGAGVDRPLKTALGTRDEDYFSLDNDPSGQFDYSSFADIPDDVNFQLIVANQFLEHLTVNESAEIIQQVFRFLEPSGNLVLTVPNVHHPTRYWGDAFHITPWPYDHLYGLVRHFGLDVTQIARYNKHAMPRNPITRYIIRAACSVFRIDWCDSILIVASKEESRT